MVLAGNGGAFRSSGLTGEIIFLASPFLCIVFCESFACKGERLDKMEIDGVNRSKVIVDDYLKTM